MTLWPPYFSESVLEWGMEECGHEATGRDVEQRGEALLAVSSPGAGVYGSGGGGATLGDAKLWAAELFPWVYCTRNISPVTPANVWIKEEQGCRKIIAV